MGYVHIIISKNQAIWEQTVSKLGVALVSPHEQTVMSWYNEMCNWYSVLNSRHQQPQFHAKHVDPIKLASMVTSVRDLLPNLGEGFVIMCLEEYNYNIETVINSLLENKLTDSLDKLSRDMTKAEAISSRNEAKTIISTRHSVFDKDEFDVFTKGTNIDLTRVHKGKKRDETTLKTLLADKDHMTDSMKERYNRYDVFGQFTKPVDFDEYDDEYDDTYDSLDVGAQDDDSADELTTRRYVDWPGYWASCCSPIYFFRPVNNVQIFLGTPIHQRTGMVIVPFKGQNRRSGTFLGQVFRVPLLKLGLLG